MRPSTAAGPQFVYNSSPGPVPLAVVGDQLNFRCGCEFWKTEGTTSGNHLLREFSSPDGYGASAAGWTPVMGDWAQRTCLTNGAALDPKLVAAVAHEMASRGQNQDPPW